VVLVRKLGVPWHEELAMGALVSGGLRVLDQMFLARNEPGLAVIPAASHG